MAKACRAPMIIHFEMKLMMTTAPENIHHSCFVRIVALSYHVSESKEMGVRQVLPVEES